MRQTFQRHRNARGMTLLEVALAVFIFMVGIVGVLAAIPTGVNSATQVIFQDASLHLGASKFAEFRRDRVDPFVDLKEFSTYMTTRQEPQNGNPGGWHDFASTPGAPYEYFDDIVRYEWKVDQAALKKIDAGIGSPAPPVPALAPVNGGGAPLNLTLVRVIIHLKGTKHEFQFTEYMYSYGRIAPADPTW
jgi:hypothetical protein